ncbi:DUF1929 domain-containing protein [Archangium gephyra]|nr:DUF1929 domain-containing protein [Archangium gephyra]
MFRHGNRLRWAQGGLLAAVGTMLALVPEATRALDTKTGHTGHGDVAAEQPLPNGLLATQGPMGQMGAWLTPAMPPEAERMQSIHTVLLPDGKVLMVSGSSNRNRIEATKDGKDGKVGDGVDVSNYDVTNNAALFDPEAPQGQPSYRKIPGPLPITRRNGKGKEYSENMDPFCSGHLQLPDGNILFAGGTQNYYPGEQFTGSRLARVFDWKTRTWRDGGRMVEGHWYPTLFPLANGQVGVISGLVDYVGGGNSSVVEFYDPTQPPEKAWKSIDIRTLPDSPFNTPVGTGTELDSLDHYPRLHPLPDGRFLLTGDGSGGGVLASRNSYYMSIEDRQGTPAISFKPGPTRAQTHKVYSSAVMDPNTPGDILVTGGMLGSENINIGASLPPSSPKVFVTGDLERFHYDADPSKARWDLDSNALGPWPDSSRIMHNMVLLPTRQFLVMGGGNFAFSRPTFNPLLMSPDLSMKGGYKSSKMNPAIQPRLYHQSALLLPDARVLVIGGNASRAARRVNGGSVRLDTFRAPNGSYEFVPHGSYYIPAENWQPEIFYPPYLFIKGERPEFERASTPALELAYEASGEVKLKAGMTPTASVVLIKLGSMTHGWDMGQRLVELEFTQDLTTRTVRLNGPKRSNTATPGYYMLFYVNSRGQPSKALMVRLS